jgi:L-fucose isomerase
MGQIEGENEMNKVKIGIRPIIDSRKLVKESLYEMTMELSQMVAELISSDLKYTDGSPVECVMNPNCISGQKEAAQAHDLFVREGVGLIISVAAGWCYPLETMEVEAKWPHAIWGFNGTQRPGAVYLAALQAAHVQKGRTGAA